MSQRVLFKFRLYTASDARNSAQALANLTAFCQAHLPNCHEIEVIDVFRESQRAHADGIRMTPTLVKVTPLPRQTIFGTLSDAKYMARTLGLEVVAA